MARFSRALCWIRRDLRLADHAALAAATRDAESVYVAFVFDTAILDELEDRDDSRVTFIHEAVTEVDSGLRERGSGLIVLHGDPVQAIPSLARDLEADLVVASRDDDPYALRRDAAVERGLAAMGVEFRTVKDHVVFERDEVLSPAGTPYQVYTPYSKAWLSRLTDADAASHDPDLSRLARIGEDARAVPTLEQIGFVRREPWLRSGQRAAEARLASYLDHIDGYAEARDFPALEATSGLSAHLRHGTLSIRSCVRAARARSGAGPHKWLLELVWRDFYQMILAHFPHVTGGAFKRQYDKIVWPGEDALYQAWIDGRTGYPVVDAAMRCLAATGWMHNRLRMACASFLVKDLLVDWRRGEAWFARRLLDFDLAQNNGGWQWAASTGVDAQPYFRIFNPVLQSRKFDPEGAFIRQWAPELTGFDGESIHAPHETPRMAQIAAGCEVGRDYPAPVVDHHVQKALAIALLESARR